MPLFRRRHDIEITLPVPTLGNLFVAPGLDPFSPEYETYGDRSGMDVIASRLKSESLKSRFRAIVELPADEVEPGVERDLHEVTRHGLRALLVGVVAVLVLNALARPLERSGDSLLEVVAEGLQITAWVILWVPIGLLVYDRWYYSRDRKIYQRILEMEIEVVARA